MKSGLDSQPALPPGSPNSGKLVQNIKHAFREIVDSPLGSSFLPS